MEDYDLGLFLSWGWRLKSRRLKKICVIKKIKIDENDYVSIVKVEKELY